MEKCNFLSIVISFVRNISLHYSMCELCNYWIHINCNNLNYIDYKFLQNSNDSWYCILCCSQIFPFNSMKSNKIFSICVSNFHNNNKPGKTNIEGSLLLKPSEI